MRIIRPVTIDGTNLTSSNVPETPPAAYNGGTTYALGDRVSVLTGFTYAVYESLQNANTGNTPASSPTWWRHLGDTYGEWNVGTTYAANDIVISTTTHHEYQSLQAANNGHSLSDAAWWLDLGPTNRFRMFDQSNSSTTTNADSIEVAVTVTGRADAVSLLTIVGASVQVVMTTVDDGEIYNQTFNLVSDSGINDWYEYFFEPIVRQGDLTIYDLPLNADPTITVTLNEPGGTATIGTLVIGQSRYLGFVLQGARTGIRDFSRKDQDEFGNFTIIPRSFSKNASFKVVVVESAIDAISTLLTTLRATPAVYIGVENYTSTWIYGWARDWSFEYATPLEAFLNLELEGLT